MAYNSSISGLLATGILEFWDIFSPGIKICGTPEDDCSEFATCANTGPGTYTCTCNEGYTGDGKSCESKNQFSTFYTPLYTQAILFLLRVHFFSFAYSQNSTIEFIIFRFIFKKSKSVELHKMTAVNLLHVLTRDLEPTRVPVMKDIPEMEKLAKVRINPGVPSCS